MAKQTKRARLAVPQELLEKTFQVNYNPNCRMPFEVRLVSMGMIDSKRDGTSKDVCGYGATLAKAARLALKKQKEYKQKQLHLQFG